MNTSSSMFQSTAAGPAADLVTSPALIGGGRRQRRFLGGRSRFPPPDFRGGAAGRGVGVVRGYGHGTTGGSGTEAVWVTSLQDKCLAAGCPPSAGFLEDVVVECCERIAELCPKFFWAWHQIFHITISPWFLLIDKFNSMVFHPTIKIT